MEDLPPERLKLLQQTMPTMPILPLDLFSRGTDARSQKFRQTGADDYIHNYPEILDLKVNEKAGTYDVVAFTNWRSEAAKRTISLRDKLGLEPGAGYVAFDFWNRKVLGVFADEITIDIEPHDTRVLAIHPVLPRPELIGNSRHLTGAYSILNQEWDSSTKKISGRAESMPDEPYTLWFYLPKGFGVKQVSVAAEGGHEIPEKHLLTENALAVSFQGQQRPVRWEISFK